MIRYKPTKRYTNPNFGQYYLSDEARSNLIQQARNLGFIKASRTGRGLSNYIEWLSQQEFYDARPEQVRESDIDRLKSNKMPYWSKEFMRKRFGLTISLSAKEAMRIKAIRFLISNANRSDGLLRETTSTVSSFLEAVGCGWLKIRT